MRDLRRSHCGCLWRHRFRIVLHLVEIRRHSIMQWEIHLPFLAVTTPEKSSTTLDWSFDNVIGTPVVSCPSASVVWGSIQFDIGITAAGAVGADISSLLSGWATALSACLIEYWADCEAAASIDDPLSSVPRIFAVVIIFLPTISSAICCERTKIVIIVMWIVKQHW